MKDDRTFEVNVVVLFLFRCLPSLVSGGRIALSRRPKFDLLQALESQDERAVDEGGDVAVAQRHVGMDLLR